MSEQWEEIDVPRGAFIGWGTRTGQHVTGRVVDYDPTGGTDFNAAPCPQLSVQLTDAAASFDKENNRTDYKAGEFVVLNCGQVSLKRAVRAADLHGGDLVKIELTNLVKVDKGQVKEYSIKVARGAGKAAAKPAAQAEPDFADSGADEEAPF